MKADSSSVLPQISELISDGRSTLLVPRLISIAVIFYSLENLADHICELLRCGCFSSVRSNARIIDGRVLAAFFGLLHEELGIVLNVTSHAREHLGINAVLLCGFCDCVLAVALSFKLVVLRFKLLRSLRSFLKVSFRCFLSFVVSVCLGIVLLGSRFPFTGFSFPVGLICLTGLRLCLRIRVLRGLRLLTFLLTIRTRGLLLSFVHRWTPFLPVRANTRPCAGSA